MTDLIYFFVRGDEHDADQDSGHNLNTRSTFTRVKEDLSPPQTLVFSKTNSSVQTLMSFNNSYIQLSSSSPTSFHFSLKRALLLRIFFLPAVFCTWLFSPLSLIPGLLFIGPCSMPLSKGDARFFFNLSCSWFYLLKIRMYGNYTENYEHSMS